MRPSTLLRTLTPALKRTPTLAPALAIVAFAALISGCTGIVVDASAEQRAGLTVATLRLQMDIYGGLQIAECLAKDGTCTPLPNNFSCQELEIDVRSDASTYIRCYLDGKLVEEKLATVADGVPIVCKATTDQACQTCFDIYGTRVLDTCNRGAQLYRSVGGGWGQSNDIPGVALLPGDGESGPDTLPGGDTPDTIPPPSSGDKCDPLETAKKFVDAFNAVLAGEKLGFKYVPDFSAIDTKNGFWSAGANYNICSAKYNHKDKCWGQGDRLQDKLQAWMYGKGGKGCFCSDNGKVCKCQRVTRKAMRMVCTYIQSVITGKCPNETEHKAALVMINGAATKFLIHGTYNQGSFPPGGNIPPTIQPPKCLSSPLVLDTKGDGIRPTSVKKGVTFDLLNQGPQRTAWISGDDALLVYDKNGNGTIDGGAELFGEGVFVNGLPAADGFEALAPFDTKALGGNENGLVEANDLLFAELRLWRDKNGDGTSQPAELTTLAAEGIAAIDLAHIDSGPNLDAHGNDLGLRGSFIKSDGSRGLMVDVSFALGR